MERRQSDGIERSLEKNVEMILEAGFDGISASVTVQSEFRRAARLVAANGKVIEAQCYPQSIEDLKPVLELCDVLGVLYLNVQPDLRPRRLAECLHLMDGWLRLIEASPFPVYFETHRNRMTNDLYLTLDLLDHFPSLRLTADLSHYVVSRELPLPVSEEDSGHIQRILNNAWALHGRVASSQQIQLEISFPGHKPWLELFLGWWRYGIRSWSRRANATASLPFVCELGPKPYAITNREGNDTTDRWGEALLLKKYIEDIWYENKDTERTRSLQ